MADQAEILKASVARVITSKTFEKSARCRELVAYLAANQASATELTSFAIAFDVFERDKDFDPSIDPIVRVHMSRTRSLLKDYYEAEGKDDAYRLELPARQYQFQLLRTPARNRSVLKKRRTYVALAIALVVAVASTAFFPYLFKQEIAPQKVSVVVRTDQHEGVDPASTESTAFLRRLGAELARNQVLSIIYLSTNGSSEFFNASDTQVADFFVDANFDHSATLNSFVVELTSARTSAVLWAQTNSVGQNESTITPNAITSIARELNTRILGEYARALHGRDRDDLSALQLFALATWVPGPAVSSLEWEVDRVALARLAIERSPDFGPAHSVLSDKLAYLAAVDETLDSESAKAEALSSAQRALELSPEDENTVFNVAQYHWHSGNLDQSVRLMERVLELDPNHGLARYFHLVYPYTCKVAPDAVVDDARSFDQSLAPDNPIRWVTLTWLGWLHLNRGEFELALAAEQRAAQIFQIPYTVVRHAAILHQLSKTDEAEELLNSQRRNWPNINAAHFADVTIPRFCESGGDALNMVQYYQELASAVYHTANQ